jgi:hypothetical protein
MKVLIGILIGIGAVVLIIVLVAGYFGFVPGVSNLFGSNKPVNLGTTYSQQDYNSAVAKSGVQYLNNVNNLSLETGQKVYGPPKTVVADFTASEALAILNDKVHAPNFPLKDFQLRVNTDGTTEIAAVMMLDKFNAYATTRGATNEGIQQVLDGIKKAGIVEKEIPVYMKGDAAIVNGQLNFDATSLKIGRLPISADILNNNAQNIIDYFNKHESDIPGFSVKNATVVNGKIHFEGTLPSSVSPK